MDEKKRKEIIKAVYKDSLDGNEIFQAVLMSIIDLTEKAAAEELYNEVMVEIHYSPFALSMPAEKWGEFKAKIEDIFKKKFGIKEVKP